jgi:hypothetical protein
MILYKPFCSGLRLSRSVKHFDDHTCGIVMQAIDEQGVERPTRNVSNSDVFNDWLPMPVPMLADYSRYAQAPFRSSHGSPWLLFSPGFIGLIAIQVASPRGGK